MHEKACFFFTFRRRQVPFVYLSNFHVSSSFFSNERKDETMLVERVDAYQNER